MTRRAVLVGLACLLLAGCGNLGSGEFVSREGGFRVRMPGYPAEEQAELMGPFYATIHHFVVEGTEVAWKVSYVDFPEGQKKPGWENDLDTCRYLLDMYPKTPHGPVPIRTSVNHVVWQGGHRGREMQVDAPDLGKSDRVRTFVVGSRLFAVRVTGTTEAVQSEEADRFLDSFAITYRPPD